MPIKPTLLGPLRIWIYPKTLRSNKVKKATPTKTQIIKIKVLKNNKIKSNKHKYYL